MDLYNHSPYVFMPQCLVKQRDNLTSFDPGDQCPWASHQDTGRRGGGIQRQKHQNEVSGEDLTLN
jgi:hypothetical protein